MKTCSEIYQDYGRLYAAMIERYRVKIGLADRRIGCGNQTFLCTHNWGNEQARKLLDRMELVTSYIIHRRDREYRKVFEIQCPWAHRYAKV